MWTHLKSKLNYKLASLKAGRQLDYLVSHTDYSDYTVSKALKTPALGYSACLWK